jgi:hypothetical protein
VHLVETDAGNAIDLRVKPRVVVAEEADAGTHVPDKIKVATSGWFD